MHYKALDGLRGLAAYTVVISHFSNQTQIFGGLFGSGAGQVGVMLFFALYLAF
jgi:peptidoglycan/LPS O-acetylase OafA/YrhL